MFSPWFLGHGAQGGRTMWMFCPWFPTYENLNEMLKTSSIFIYQKLSLFFSPELSPLAANLKHIFIAHEGELSLHILIWVWIGVHVRTAGKWKLEREGGPAACARCWLCLSVRLGAGKWRLEHEGGSSNVFTCPSVRLGTGKWRCSVSWRGAQRWWLRGTALVHGRLGTHSCLPGRWGAGSWALGCWFIGA